MNMSFSLVRMHKWATEAGEDDGVRRDGDLIFMQFRWTYSMAYCHILFCFSFNVISRIVLRKQQKHMQPAISDYVIFDTFIPDGANAMMKCAMPERKRAPFSHSVCVCIAIAVSQKKWKYFA